MTKFCSRLLVALVLAGVVLAVCGAGYAPDRSSRWSHPSGTSPAVFQRPGAGSCSGEPDGSGQGAPQPVVKPSSLVSTSPSFWLAQLWLQWRLRGQSDYHRPIPR